MSQFRLCDLCGQKLTTDIMDYTNLRAKDQNQIFEKDICNSCMNGAVRITLPDGLTVTGMGALTGDYSPAADPQPPVYQENPATMNKPKEENDNAGDDE